jgi:hypothetical protein
MSDATAEDAAMSQLQLIKALFCKVDASDADDRDAGELGRLINTLGMGLSPEELHSALGALDIDNSGASSIANFTEWWKANGVGANTESEAAEEVRARALAAFQTIDVDNGGTIDASELGMLATVSPVAVSRSALAFTPPK